MVLQQINWWKWLLAPLTLVGRLQISMSVWIFKEIIWSNIHFSSPCGVMMLFRRLSIWLGISKWDNTSRSHHKLCFWHKSGVPCLVRMHKYNTRSQLMIYSSTLGAVVNYGTFVFEHICQRMAHLLYQSWWFLLLMRNTISWLVQQVPTCGVAKFPRVWTVRRLPGHSPNSYMDHMAHTLSFH